MACIVDDDVDPASVGEDMLDGRVDRLLVADIELCGVQLDRPGLGAAGCLGDGGLIAGGGAADAGVDRVPGVGEGPDGHGTEAA